MRSRHTNFLFIYNFQPYYDLFHILPSVKLFGLDWVLKFEAFKRIIVAEYSATSFDYIIVDLSSTNHLPFTAYFPPLSGNTCAYLLQHGHIANACLPWNMSVWVLQGFLQKSVNVMNVSKTFQCKRGNSVVFVANIYAHVTEIFYCVKFNGTHTHTQLGGM